MSSRKDREALRQFFNATGGPSWHRKSGWEDGNHNLSGWEGVSVNTSSRVIGIQLSGNNLEGAQDTCLLIVINAQLLLRISAVWSC